MPQSASNAAATRRDELTRRRAELKSPEAEPDWDLAAVENAFRVSQQIEQVRHQTKAAQRSAPESIARSADSHDRTAKSYQRLAELNVYGTDDREHQPATASSRRRTARWLTECEKSQNFEWTGNPARKLGARSERPAGALTLCPWPKGTSHLEGA